MRLDKRKNIRSGFFSLTAFSMVEKVIAYVYQATMAAALGAGMMTDCYSSASQLFDLIDSTVLGAMVIVSLREYNEVRSVNEKKGDAFLSNVNSCLAVFMLFFSVLVLVMARPLSYVIAPGFQGDSRENVILCIRIMCVIPAIMSQTPVRQVLLRHNRQFLVVNSRSLCISLCGFAALAVIRFIKPQTPAMLCVGYVFSSLLFTFVLFISSRKYGQVRFVRPSLNSETKKLIRMAIPVIVSSGIVRVSLMIDQIIASSSPNGSITCLYYSQQLYHIVSGFLIVNLGMIILTDFVKSAVEKDYAEILRRIRKAVSSIFLLLVPVTIITLLFSKEIVSIAYRRGAFGDGATIQVAGLLFFYAIGFVPELYNNIFSQVLFSFGKTKVTMINSLIAMGINIATSVILSKFVGLVGIAVGTSFSQLCMIPFNRGAVKKNISSYRSALELKYVLKLLLSAAAGTAAAVAVKFFELGAFASFVLATLLMFSVFFASMLALRDETTVGYYRKLVGLFRKR